MARKKKGEKKNVTLILVLVGIMFFGTLAGGLLFQKPGQDAPPIITGPPQAPTTLQEETMTIRHNPVDATTLTAFGYQTISHNDTHISVDSNNPLANKTLTFDIKVLNMTRVNYTGDTGDMTVEKGDTVEVDYTGRLESGAVFDTSYSETARNASVPKAPWFNERPFYEPLEFITGAGMMIEGFDEAVIGMKINETKTVEIPPEKAYGLHDPSLVETVPITQEIQKTMVITRFKEFVPDEFRKNFGNVNITLGQTFNVPGTNFNASIFYTTENRVVIEMLLEQGAIVKMQEFPWNSTVISGYQGAIILEHNVKSGDTIQFPGMPWNTTVL